jgi:intracellular sulfur oxidation DsrE/DsrF family protein
MNKDEHFSEEQLNAFVDGELDPEEKSRLFNEAERSANLDQRLCKQRKIKELIQYAYADIPPVRRLGGTPLARTGLFGKIIAAGFLLAVGLSAGVVAHNYFGPHPGGEFVAASAVYEPAAEIENYLLHVVSGEPEQMLAALEQARFLLESADESEFRQVEIIANEQGLDLLRTDVTPFAAEISALQRSNVVFYACSKTIQRLEERGVKVELVPYTNPNYTALDRVVTRMQAGWKYEKI